MAVVSVEPVVPVIPVIPVAPVDVVMPDVSVIVLDVSVAAVLEVEVPAVVSVTDVSVVAVSVVLSTFLHWMADAQSMAAKPMTITHLALIVLLLVLIRRAGGEAGPYPAMSLRPLHALAAILVLSAAACTDIPEHAIVSEDAQLSGRCAVALAQIAKTAGLAADAHGSTVAIAGKRLELSAKREEEKESEGLHLAGLSVTTSSSNSRFTFGSVGVGRNSQDAWQTAVNEWASLAGVAILRAEFPAQRSDEFFPLGTETAYPGATGVRGSHDLKWSAEQGRQLLNAMKPALQPLLSPAEPHTLYLMMVVKPDGKISGQAQWDTKPDASLLEAATKFPWPVLHETYMFKQAYVIR